MNLRPLALASLAFGCRAAPPPPRGAPVADPPPAPVAPITAPVPDDRGPCHPRVEVRTVAAPNALLFRLCDDGRLYSGVTRIGQLDARPAPGGLREELRLIANHETLFIDRAAPAAFVVDPDETLHGGPRLVSHRLTRDGRVLGASGAAEITVGPDGVISAGEVTPQYRATPTTAEARRDAALLVFVMHSLMQ
jgi:hypothetical protein